MVFLINDSLNCSQLTAKIDIAVVKKEDISLSKERHTNCNNYLADIVQH